MSLTNLERVFILNLKGRVSKALNTPSGLKDEEKNHLEGVFNAIDKLLLYKGSTFKKAKESFKNTLSKSVKSLGKTNKKYVKDHILPLINKISIDKWDG